MTEDQKIYNRARRKLSKEVRELWGRKASITEWNCFIRKAEVLGDQGILSMAYTQLAFLIGDSRGGGDVLIDREGSIFTFDKVFVGNPSHHYPPKLPAALIAERLECDLQ